MNLQAHLTAMPLAVQVTGGFLVMLVLIAVFGFFVPALAYLLRLRGIQQRIAKFEPRNYAGQFKAVFATDKRLAQLWKEYQDSLHKQSEERDGQMQVIAVRATAPAEMYFSAQFVVDSRLHTEFFKHTPGIFTGVGIIGTFSGLISGLGAFERAQTVVAPSMAASATTANAAAIAALSANAARSGLTSLMQSVGDAFIVSAVAITAAMVFTFFEKLLLAALYRRAEEIALAIDTCFEAGAGEEYLSRLVNASEESASQSKILKDALVKELGDLLRDLTQAQIAASGKHQSQGVERLVQASRQDNQELAQAIALSIQQSLKGPLEDIAGTVKAASGDQSANAVRMLQDVMVSFSQRLSDLFGGQIAGLNDLNQQTARGMQDAVATLQALVANLEATGRRSADAMAQRMAEAVEKMEARQGSMNEQTAAFVEQIRALVSSSQSETNQKLQVTLQTIGEQVSGMLGALTELQGQVFEGNREREQAMTERAQGAVSVMSDSVEAVVRELGAATKQMAQSVAALTHATTSSVDKMNAGADLLGTASRNFAAAGERVSGVMGQAVAVSGKLSEASGGLSAGSAALQKALEDYRQQREVLAQLVQVLRSTVEAARKEASLTSDVLARIDSAASRLAAAQKQADEYLAGVSQVLGAAHASFATEVTRTLDKANHEFHTKLTTAVSMLSSAVGELELTLASMGNMAPARR